MIRKSTVQKMIDESLRKEMSQWTKNMNDQVLESVVKRDEWRKHAKALEDHGIQIERFLASFETIAKEMLGARKNGEGK